MAYNACHMKVGHLGQCWMSYERKTSWTLFQLYQWSVQISNGNFKPTIIVYSKKLELTSSWRWYTLKVVHCTHAKHSRDINIKLFPEGRGLTFTRHFAGSQALSYRFREKEIAHTDSYCFCNSDSLSFAAPYFIARFYKGKNL